MSSTHDAPVPQSVELTCMHPGGTNRFVDQQNPDNLGRQPTDHGTVPNLKWRFSDSKTEVRPGGWLRSATKDDLAQSQDVSSTQVHLSKGAIRESHWHSVVGSLQTAKSLLFGGN